MNEAVLIASGTPAELNLRLGEHGCSRSALEERGRGVQGLQTSSLRATGDEDRPGGEPGAISARRGRDPCATGIRAGAQRERTSRRRRFAVREPSLDDVFLSPHGTSAARRRTRTDTAEPACEEPAMTTGGRTPTCRAVSAPHRAGPDRSGDLASRGQPQPDRLLARSPRCSVLPHSSSRSSSPPCSATCSAARWGLLSGSI